MAIAALIISSLVALAIALTLSASRRYRAGASAALLCIFVSCMLPVAAGLTALSLWLICMGLAMAGRKPTGRAIAIVTLTGVVAGMGSGVLLSLRSVQHLRALRKSYPFVSVASRLDYESKENEPKPVTERLGDGGRARAPGGDAASRSGAGAQFRPPPLGSPAWTALNAADDHDRGWVSRRRTLEVVHASIVEQFANAPGFGMARMPYMIPFDLKERSEPPVELRGTKDESPSPGHPDPLRGVPLSFARPGTTPSRFERLWQVHKSGLRDFFDPDDEGLVLDRDHVAGFVPHRFSQDFPPPPPSGRLLWELCRLELVSLRRFGRPMVSATNRKLPRMDDLSHVPTRELNGFEAGALESLAKGEELAYAQQGKSVLALGAVRARDTCTKCHEVERGALLGAFSYEFLGNATPAHKAPPAKPPI
jgi:hypothetical protein